MLFSRLTGNNSIRFQFSVYQVMKQVFLLSLSILLWTNLFLSANAQHGHLYLSRYRPEGHKSGYHCMTIHQAENRVMYFGGPGGITLFDGVRSQKIKTGSSVFALAQDTVSGKIYAACRNSFGYISKDIFGQESYRILSDQFQEVGDVHQVFVSENDVCFVTDNRIFRLDKKNNTILQEISFQEKKYAGAFRLKDQVYVNLQGEGLFYVLEDTLLPAGIKDFKQRQILFHLPAGENKVLLGINDNRLYFFNGKQVEHFTVKDENNLSHWLFVDAVSLSDDKFALATASAGCLIISLKTGETLHNIDFFKGLPDDEIFALGLDKEGGLWLAHEGGFSRADSRAPFRLFSYYPGLEGNIISVLESDKYKYVATNEGLFFLDELKKGKAAASNIIYNTNRYKKNRRAYFSSAYNERASERNAFDYCFKVIPGINGKCRSLFTVNDKLYVATNTGLYQVWGKTASSIIRDVYINSVSFDNKGRIYLGMKNGILLVNSKKAVWKGMEVKSLLCTGDELWFESEGKIHKGILNKAGLLERIHTYPADNFSGEVQIRVIENEVYFFSKTKRLKYDRKKSKIIELKEEDKFYSSEYLFSQQNISWFRSDTGWIGIGNKGNRQLLNKYMLVHQNLERVFLTGNNHLWIINSNNELIRIVQGRNHHDLFDIGISSISTDKGRWCEILNPELPHNYNSLTFHLSAPHYLANEGVTIQYRLQNLMDDWSGWSESMDLQFPFLPSGEHQLSIRAKNSLGEISEIKTVKFSVVPPYWKTGWFYFLEILFFAALILISVMVNRNSKNIFLTKALTFLTLIILVEFVDEVIKASWSTEDFESPVISFSLDVLLALLITPIEKLMEILILKRKRQLLTLLLLWRKTISIILNRNNYSLFWKRVK